MKKLFLLFIMMTLSFFGMSQVPDMSHVLVNDIKEYMNIIDTATCGNIEGAFYVTYTDPPMNQVGGDLSLITKLAVGFYNPSGELIRRPVWEEFIRGSLQPGATEGVFVLKLAGSNDGANQTPGDTLVVFNKDFEPIDSLHTDSWYSYTDYMGNETPLLLDGHDHTVFMWHDTVHYQVIGYHDEYLRYADYGVSCPTDSFLAHLTSVHIFNDDFQEIAKFEPWKAHVHEDIIACRPVVRPFHINRIDRQNLKATENSVTITFSARNEGYVMRTTYHQGNPQMSLDWMFGQPIQFNTATDHGYTDGQISSVNVSDSLDFVHGAGCIEVGDTTFVVTYNNNNSGFAELTAPAKHTLYKVFASGDSTVAQEVWALCDHASPEYYSFATGEARWLPTTDSPLILFQEGLGGEVVNGTPLDIMNNADIEGRHDEFVIRNITGGVVATMDWPGHGNTPLEHVSKEHLPNLDSIEVIHDGGIFTLTSPSEVIWEQYGQVISEGNSLTISDTSNLDHVHGWLPINLYSWRLPKKSALWTGIGEEPVPQNITFWPNPSSGIVNLSRATDVKVFSMTGTLIIEHTGVKSFSTNALSAGVYVLELKDKRALLVVE